MLEHHHPDGFSKFHRELLFRSTEKGPFYTKIDNNRVFRSLLDSDLTSVLAPMPKKCGTVSSKMVQNSMTEFRLL